MSHRTRLRTPLLALLAFALPLGCDSEPAKDKGQTAPKVEPATPTPEVKATTPTPETPPAAIASTGEGPTVTLVDAGAEPRETLRLKVQAGQAQAMVMTMRMQMAMDMGPAMKLPPTKIPPVQMTMNTTVKSAAPGGDIQYEFTLDKVDVLDDPSVMPEVATQMRLALGSMQKISGSSTVTDRGLVKSADFNIPPDVNPQIKQTMESMRQSVNQLSVPFPVEALGVGAKWTVTQNIDQQGMKLQQLSTYELKARNGTALTLASTIVQTAQPQDMNPPGLPPGTSVHLDSLSSTGSGESQLDLTKLAPTSARMALKSAIKMVTKGPGVNMNTAMDMDLEMEIGGK